jgi:hypothetical protein
MGQLSKPRRVMLLLGCLGVLAWVAATSWAISSYVSGPCPNSTPECEVARRAMYFVITAAGIFTLLPALLLAGLAARQSDRDRTRGTDEGS